MILLLHRMFIGFSILITIGRRVKRRRLGLPSSWAVVLQWLTVSMALAVPVISPPAFSKKWQQIEVLSDYRSFPHPSFWDNFPQRHLPLRPHTTVKYKELKQLILANKSKLTRHQLKRALRVCRDLEKGG